MAKVSQATTTAGLELIKVPSMSKSTDSTLISTMCGSLAGVIAPEEWLTKEPLLELATEGGAVPAGVGMADMVKACFVKTDMLVEYVCVMS